MRICHVVGDSAFGGGSRIVMSLAQASRDDGNKVCVLATATAFRCALQSAGIPCLPLDCIWRPVRLHRDLVGLARLVMCLRSERFDLVHTHTSKAGFVGRLGARLARVPFIVHTVHGFAFHEASPRLRIATYAGLERMAAHWCDRLVTVSEHHRDWARRLGIGRASQVVAIPNGVDAPAVVSPDDIARLRQSLGIAADDIVILTIGRLAAEKGLEDLLAAFAVLARDSTQTFRLLLAGDGPLEPALRARAKVLSLEHEVVFLGFREDVAALLAAADLVALPSLREGLSIALLEAMAAGRPVVATNLPSNVEASAGGTVVRLVPRRSPDRLAEALMALGRDPASRLTLARAGHARWACTYSLRAMLDGYRELYADLVPSYGRSLPTA